MINKKEKKKKPRIIRMIGALCSLLLIGSLIYILSAGFNYVAGLVIVAAVSGLVGPSVASGAGFIDIISGIFEMIIEGIQAIFEAIIEAISSIFGG